MDWTDFQFLYWFFKKGEKVMYLGTPEILRFTTLNSKKVYYISPEKVEFKSPRLKKFVENPQEFDLSLLPKKLDRIINFLPFNLVASFKIMGKYLNLLEADKKEIKISIETISKYSPDLFLIDGSLIINPADVPKKDSSVYMDYTEVKKLLDRLYELAKKKNCMLAGVVEDSRSSTFCGSVAKNILDKVKSPKIPGLTNILNRTRDTNLLYYMLKKGEATKNIDLEGEVKCFYLRSAEFDRPIRVEFIEREKEIAEIIYTISSQSRTYGLPNVLIEADQRAKLSENDTDYYTNLIASKLGVQNIFFLRRENRPF